MESVLWQKVNCTCVKRHYVPRDLGYNGCARQLVIMPMVGAHQSRSQVQPPARAPLSTPSVCSLTSQRPCLERSHRYFINTYYMLPVSAKRIVLGLRTCMAIKSRKRRKFSQYKTSLVKIYKHKFACLYILLFILCFY